jgi:hypothetical protein
MNELENDLRSALKRTDAPPGFTGRVMDRIPEKRAEALIAEAEALIAEKVVTIRPVRRWRKQWLAAAAALSIGVIGGEAWEQHQRRIQGERAKQELMYALTVVSGTLQTTKQILTR